MDMPNVHNFTVYPIRALVLNKKCHRPGQGDLQSHLARRFAHWQLFLLQNFELCFYFRVLAFYPEVDSLSPVTFSSRRKLRRWLGWWKWLIRTRRQPECLQSPVLLEGREVPTVLSWGRTAAVRQQRGASLWSCAASRRGVRSRWKGRGGVFPWCTIRWKLNTDFEILSWLLLRGINFGSDVPI